MLTFASDRQGKVEYLKSCAKCFPPMRHVQQYEAQVLEDWQARQIPNWGVMHMTSQTCCRRRDIPAQNGKIRNVDSVSKLYEILFVAKHAVVAQLHCYLLLSDGRNGSPFVKVGKRVLHSLGQIDRRSTSRSVKRWTPTVGAGPVR